MSKPGSAGAAITDEIVEKVRASFGKVEKVGAWFNEEATRDTIRHYALGIGDLNPLWLNEEYAKRTRYGTIVAPPTFLFSCALVGRLGMPGVHGMFSGAEWEFYEPVRLGDRISVTSKVVDLVEKRSRFSGRQFQQIWEVVYRNQRDEIVAKDRVHGMRQERDLAHEMAKYAGITKQSWTPETLAPIWRSYEEEEIRGAKPRFWEDVAVGEELKPCVKGPLTVRDCIAWVMGGGSPYIRAHRDSSLFMKRHPGAYIVDELGVPDVPERVHWTDEFALKVGVPGIYDYGPQRVAWLGHLMTNWIGDDGWLAELRVQVRMFNIIGDVQWCKGRVTNKYIEGGKHVVDCEIWAENQRGEITAPGFAKVILPSKTSSR